MKQYPDNSVWVYPADSHTPRVKYFTLTVLPTDSSSITVDGTTDSTLKYQLALYLDFKIAHGEQPANT